MKRYLAFYGKTHYSRAAMRDYFGSFDTLEDAIRAIDIAHELYERTNYYGIYGIVWDSKTMLEVYNVGETYD